MENNKNIFGCFVSYQALSYKSKETEKLKSKEQGDLFRSYIWGEKGISTDLKRINNEDYGKDLMMILFQFYINPIEQELMKLKEIESYRKKEKAIGIPIIVNDENFFNQNEKNRILFLKESIINKILLVEKVVKKRQLDTNIEKLKLDLYNMLN